MKFTEAKLEAAFTELLGNENYPHQSGKTIVRSIDQVLSKDDLMQYLLL